MGFSARDESKGMGSSRGRAGDGSMDMPMADLIRREVQAELSIHYERIMMDVEQRIAAALGKGSAQTKFSLNLPKDRPLQVVEGASPRMLELSPRHGQKTEEDNWPNLGGGAAADRGKGGYTPLQEIDEEGKIVRRMSESQNAWIDTWLETVEAGELDVYTCLGLSNAFTNTPDTRKIWAKACSVTVLQLLVPSIMLLSEFLGGLTIHPSVSDPGFRFIGAVLYGYSVYTMYNNADGECRCRLLNMMMHHQDVPAGFWVPLIVGEILNVFVAMILVLTLYQIYTHQDEPADLILNAVAVNFLGSVDSEFVNHDMEKDAISNFKEFSNDHFSRDNAKGQEIDESTESWVDFIVRIVLYGVATCGLIGAAMFLFVSTAEKPEKQINHSARHANLPHPDGYH